MVTTSHLCWKCGKRLPVGHVVGQAQVFCRYCKNSTLVVGTPAPMVQRPREMC